MVILKIRITSWIVIVLKKDIQIVIQKDIQLDKMLDNFNRALRGRFNEISRILTRSIDSTQPYLHAKIEE